MVLELITAYGIIVGTIVGTGHALYHMHGEPEATGSVETLPVLPSAEMPSDKNYVPIDTLSELKEEQFISSSKTLVTGETSNGEGSVKKQSGIQVVDDTMIESSTAPVSAEEGVERSVKTYRGRPKARQEKPYDIFEAVGFEDDENFDNWAK